MNDSQKYIKNLIFDNDGLKVVQNTPTQYASRQKQYLAERTIKFTSSRAYLSSDYCQAEIQGLTSNFYDYITTNIRLADITSPSASTSKRTDDFKQVFVADDKIDYLPIGAKINTMGNTWLVVNPSNISTVLTTSVVARCNATYNSFDYYGNIITEPIVVEKYAMSGNDNDNPLNIVLMDGYFNITCQLNENTQKLGINKRIILGNKPYYITGFTDFIQEFTSKRDSVHLITFTARLDEPTVNDDLVNYIANGKSYKFGAELNGLSDLIAGTQTTLTPSFLINGEQVESTVEYPLTWNYHSSDNQIASVSQNGIVTSKKEGTVIITATLAENTAITATLELVVTEQLSAPYVAFDGFTADYISQYDKATFTATYFENNFATNYPLTWSFSGATKKDYIATVSEDGKSVVIECISASEKPLSIKASYNGYSAKIKIHLVGY